MLNPSYSSSHKDEDEDLYEDFQYSNDAINQPPMTGFHGSMQSDQSNLFNSRPSSNRVPMSSMGRGPMPSSYGSRLMTGQVPGTRSGMSTAFQSGMGESRPMTSVSGAGFKSSSQGNKKTFNPLGEEGTSSSGLLVSKQEGGPEYVSKQLEKQVHYHMEEASRALVSKKYPTCLEHAREAGKKERALTKHREKNGMSDQVNLDLTFAVCFLLADAFHKNRMYEEAINAYTMLIKNKQFPHAGRMRINLGNIYFEKGEYPQAVKLYRMALDQVSSSTSASLALKHHILKNIGHAFVKMGQYQDAIQSYEAIVTSVASAYSGESGEGGAVHTKGMVGEGGLPPPLILFHLLLGYFAMGNQPAMKATFEKLVLSYSFQGFSEEEEEEEEVLRNMRRSISDGGRNEGKSGGGFEGKGEEDEDEEERKELDELRKELMKKQKKVHKLILRASKLIAPVLTITNDDEEDDDEEDDEHQRSLDALLSDGKDRGQDDNSLSRDGRRSDQEDINRSGWQWIVQMLRSENLAVLAGEVEVEFAVYLMNHKQFDEAIDLLKSVEGRAASMRTSSMSTNLYSVVATSLSFLYLLEGEDKKAGESADEALKHDRYNARALVNKGICLMRKGEEEEEQEIRKAIIQERQQESKKRREEEEEEEEGFGSMTSQENRMSDAYYEQAKELFLEAIGVEADCVEAIFNLGLVNMKLGNLVGARQAFDKLNTILPSQPEVLLNLSYIQQQLGNLPRSIQILEQLHAKVPGDESICVRLGQLHLIPPSPSEPVDETQALHWYLEAYNHYPMNLDVISWLGVYFVRCELYEKAISFFRQAHHIQPQEEKWRLMIASCLRRMGSNHEALEEYLSIHQTFPESIEPLKYAIALSRELGRPHQHLQELLEQASKSTQVYQKREETFVPTSQPQQVAKEPPTRPSQPPTRPSQPPTRPSLVMEEKKQEPFQQPNHHQQPERKENIPTFQDDQNDNDFDDVDVGELLG